MFSRGLKHYDYKLTPSGFHQPYLNRLIAGENLPRWTKGSAVYMLLEELNKNPEPEKDFSSYTFSDVDWYAFLHYIFADPDEIEKDMDPFPLKDVFDLPKCRERFATFISRITQLHTTEGLLRFFLSKDFEETFLDRADSLKYIYADCLQVIVDECAFILGGFVQHQSCDNSLNTQSERDKEINAKNLKLAIDTTLACSTYLNTSKNYTEDWLRNLWESMANDPTLHFYDVMKSQSRNKIITGCIGILLDHNVFINTNGSTDRMAPSLGKCFKLDGLAKTSNEKYIREKCKSQKAFRTWIDNYVQNQE